VKIPGVQNRILKNVIRYTKGVKQISNTMKTNKKNIFSIQKMNFERTSETSFIIEGNGVNGIISNTSKLNGALWTTISP
jgi:hypothetical protein